MIGLWSSNKYSWGGLGGNDVFFGMVRMAIVIMETLRVFVQLCILLVIKGYPVSLAQSVWLILAC